MSSRNRPPRSRPGTRWGLVPTEKLRLNYRLVGVVAVNEPQLRSTKRSPRAQKPGRRRDGYRGPDRIEIAEEENRDRKVERDQRFPAWPRQLAGEECKHEGESQDHEDEPAEHVVQEQHARDRKPRQVRSDEAGQDDRRQKAPVAD